MLFGGGGDLAGPGWEAGPVVQAHLGTGGLDLAPRRLAVPCPGCPQVCAALQADKADDGRHQQCTAAAEHRGALRSSQGPRPSLDAAVQASMNSMHHLLPGMIWWWCCCTLMRWAWLGTHMDGQAREDWPAGAAGTYLHLHARRLMRLSAIRCPQPLFGFLGNSDPAKFVRAAGHPDVYFTKDEVVPLEQVPTCNRGGVCVCVCCVPHVERAARMLHPCACSIHARRIPGPACTMCALHALEAAGGKLCSSTVLLYGCCDSDTSGSGQGSALAIDTCHPSAPVPPPP